MKKIFFSFLFLLIFFGCFSYTFSESKKTSLEYADIVSDYQLPYPGLLPDSPFYFLKMARDRIISLFISDPLKKAQFDILQADKRLNAGIFLFIRPDRKYQLAITTISKGENYYEDALSKLQDAKQQGMQVSDTGGNLIASLKNQKQILEKLEIMVSGQNRQDLLKSEKSIEQFEKEATSNKLR